MGQWINTFDRTQRNIHQMRPQKWLHFARLAILFLSSPHSFCTHLTRHLPL
jgi:hypothetical protein